MKIELKTICPEIFGKLPNGEYEVPDGCDAKSALQCCVDQYDGDDVRRDCIERVIFMRSGQHIQPDCILQEGDRLMALRPVHGG